VKKQEKLLKLSTVLGYQFNDIKLLQQALTHRSAAAKHNERFEFLGDSIINFLMAEALYHARAFAKEGELSRLRASLVKGETLAEIARDFELGQYLFLGSGELKSGGHQRDSILADAVEAIIAAIYLDSNMETCREVVTQWFSERLSDLSKYKAKDPKTNLQEYLQSKSHDLPKYTVVNVEGEPHAQTFTVLCEVAALDLTAEGKANSRRRAEQAAADKLMKTITKKKGNKQ